MKGIFINKEKNRVVKIIQKWNQDDNLEDLLKNNLFKKFKDDKYKFIEKDNFENNIMKNIKRGDKVIKNDNDKYEIDKDKIVEYKYQLINESEEDLIKNRKIKNKNVKNIKLKKDNNFSLEEIKKIRKKFGKIKTRKIKKPSKNWKEFRKKLREENKK